MLCQYTRDLEEARTNGHTIDTNHGVSSRAIAEQMRAIGYSTGKSSVGDHLATNQRCSCKDGHNGKISPDAVKHVRVLTLDIETAPNLAYVWGLWDQNVGLNQLREVSTIICFVAKWYDTEEVIFHSDHHDGHEQMIRKLHDLITEADIVVHYNGISFDMKHIHREFLLAGMNPPRTYKNVDLMRVAKQKFKFVSNKLDHIAQQLGLGGKTAHTGFDLWLGCMQGDEDSWALMEEYNRQDVNLTERLYDRLRPWISNHPHLGTWSGEEWSCPNCGHKDISNNRDGESHANVQRYREYACPSCGARVRGNKKLLDATQTRAAVSR